jgi:2-(1,2-epoxy-1,2-dihydrophenyl)acetyl-CoA isomerase
MGYERLKLEHRGQVAVLRFNNPELLNAVDGRMLEELAVVLRELGGGGVGTRCLLLTGEGRAFCSGADVSGVRAAGGSVGERLRALYHPILVALRDLEMPFVTAVNGPAAGVGMSFAIMGDIVCASRNAYFLQAFVRIGLVPDGGATFLLPRRIGWGRAVELSMLGERLPAEKALEWGLVNRLFDDPAALLAGALEIAETLARGPRSLALIRRAYWETWRNGYEQQLDLEARLQNEATRTADFAEGVGAFLEKRPARFTGT